MMRLCVFALCVMVVMAGEAQAECDGTASSCGSPGSCAPCGLPNVCLDNVCRGPEPIGSCFKLYNGGFDNQDTIAPWLTASYLGGSNTCDYESSPEQCELLQQNALNGGSNSGRTSVGQDGDAICRQYPDQAVGVNLYQANIGMCKGLVVSADVGQQDRREGAVTRVPTTFSLVVGNDVFDLMGGTHTQVASVTLMPPSAAPFIGLQETSLSGTWNPDPDCEDICPQDDCYAVGVRIARDENFVNSAVRQFIDNLALTDVTPPVITVSSQTVQASSCGGSVTVDMGATAVDNCCQTVTIAYSIDGADRTTNPVGSFTVGCTDVTVYATDESGREASANFQVCVQQPSPAISCNGDVVETTQTCWSTLPANSGAGATPTVNCDGDTPTFVPALDSEFRLGNTEVTATIEQDDGLGNTWTASCTFNVRFNMCCTTPPNRDKRTPSKTLQKL